MDIAYLIILGFLFVLAVFGLFVGVSNDAVNFLNSAIGAKAAKYKTVLCIASLGILVGAVLSAGMMDVARHGVMNPSGFSFHEVMIIFFAVMVSNVMILDLFNTMGLPTSTTVSLVFGLLGATFVMALIKTGNNPQVGMDKLLNSSKALQMIIAIFVSVAIAFVCGLAVQYLSRLVFTFNYQSKLRYTVAIFGGISFTVMAYFIFFKGLGASPFIGAGPRGWIAQHSAPLLAGTFAFTTLLSQILHLCRVNVFRIVVLLGTFALAMAFAGNDLVNFIGVPMAGLSSVQDYLAHGGGDARNLMMDSLQDSARSPFLYLFASGLIMVVAMITSKKAQNVLKTSINLSRQDEGDELFGSSYAARRIVRASQNLGTWVTNLLPASWLRWIDSRFNKQEAVLPQDASFDLVRAAINLVLASALIVIGTLYKLPLSTTYVTFMVAMGSSLADRAWSRESAVFRVTGVISVIGGWFITAALSFAVCALAAALIHLGGLAVMVAFVALVVFLLVRSYRKYNHKESKQEKDVFRVMLHSKDPEIVRDLLLDYMHKSQSQLLDFIRTQYGQITGAIQTENLKSLRSSHKALETQKEEMEKQRRQGYLALRRCPQGFALERNTWFHLAQNSDQQYCYCLKRMLNPAIEHFGNLFNPLPQAYIDHYQPLFQKVDALMEAAVRMMAENDYSPYRRLMTDADQYKTELSLLRKTHLNHMHQHAEQKEYKVSLLFLNQLQETQEMLNILRHQMRATKKFMKQRETSPEHRGILPQVC